MCTADYYERFHQLLTPERRITVLSLQVCDSIYPIILIK